MTDNSKPTLADIQQAMRELEQLGLIRKTGEFRNGRRVYEITELGRAAHLTEQ